MQSEVAAQPGATLPLQEGTAEMTEEDKDAQESSLYKEDSFRMYCMKVLPCSKRYCHDWTTCPFSHPGEKARRRDPRTQPHTGIACPDRKKEGTCIRGDNCPYAHNVFEYWLHPTRYRTQLCNDGAKCRRHICFFAHSLEELRVPSCKPFVPPDALAAATTAAAADAARKTAAATSAGAMGALDPATLRALAQAVANGAAASQQDSQELELARTILQAPNAATSALINQLSQMQMQSQHASYQQQQQEQLNAISVLTAYLKNAQGQPQNQTQPPQMPQLPEQHAIDSWQHQEQQPGLGDRQQLAFRSLSEAAADRRSSDMLRAQLHAQATSSGSLPTDHIPHSNSFLSPAVTAGTTLAQQSLLYAPTQAGQQAMDSAAQQVMFPQISPHGFSPRHPFGSQTSSFDMPRSSFSDGARRGSFSQQDWMSVGTSGRYSSGQYSGERYSMDRRSFDRRSLDRHSGENEMFGPGNAFGSGARRSSYGGPMMANNYEADWAGRSVSRNDAAHVAGFHPHPQEPLGNEGFNPFSNYLHPGYEGQFSRDAFNRNAFHSSGFQRASQDSDASTHMHTEGRPSLTMDDRPSMDSIRSGFASPNSPSMLHSAVGHDCHVAWPSSRHLPQHQQHLGPSGMSLLPAC